MMNTLGGLYCLPACLPALRLSVLLMRAKCGGMWWYRGDMHGRRRSGLATCWAHHSRSWRGALVRANQQPLPCLLACLPAQQSSLHFDSRWEVLL
jgi:hypothetical protein